MTQLKSKPKIKTRQNLEAAFAGESMAYQKYMYFAKIARKLGNEDVAKLFQETAAHEVGHAEGHLNFLYPPETLTVEKIIINPVIDEAKFVMPLKK